MDNEEVDFEQQQEEISEMSNVAAGLESGESKGPNMTINHMLDHEQAESVNTIRSRIESIRKEVERTGKYYDRENNVNLSRRQAEAKIKSLENQIYKEMGYPWYERNATNPLAAILQAIAKMLMYILDAEYRRSKKMALEREDDSIRSQMDIKLSNIRKLAEHEVENYLNPQRNMSFVKEDAEVILGSDPSFAGVGNKKTKDSDFDLGNWPDDIKKGENALDTVEIPVQKTSAEQAKEDKKREISEKIQLKRNNFAIEKYGNNYADMTPAQKAEVNARFIVCETHTKKTKDGKVKNIPNYKYIDFLEENAKNENLAKALFEAMEERLPDNAKKHYEENTIQCVPFVAPFYLSKIKNELMEKGESFEDIQKAIDKNAARMMVINPQVLKYLPEAHLNDKRQELTALYRQELIEKHIKDQEREYRSIEKLTKNGKDISEAYKAPEVTKYLDDLRRVADKEDFPAISKLVTSIYTEYVLDYVRGYDMNFSKESAHENENTVNVTIPESVIDSEAFQNELAAIASDRESRDLLREFVESTIDRIDREKDITPPGNTERLEQLEIEKEGLEQLVSEFDRLDEKDKELDMGEPIPDDGEQRAENADLSNEEPEPVGPADEEPHLEPEDDKDSVPEKDPVEPEDLPELPEIETSGEGVSPEKEPDLTDEGPQDALSGEKDIESLFENDDVIDFDPNKIGPAPEVSEEIQNLFSSFDDAVESIENSASTEEISIEKDNDLELA